MLVIDVWHEFPTNTSRRFHIAIQQSHPSIFHSIGPDAKTDRPTKTWSQLQCVLLEKQEVMRWIKWKISVVCNFISCNPRLFHWVLTWNVGNLDQWKWNGRVFLVGTVLSDIYRKIRIPSPPNIFTFRLLKDI